MSAENATAVVEVDGLRFSYPVSRKKNAARAALDSVSFTVSRGEIFGLLGPNGGGKTTLFRILATLMEPSSGSARIFGLDVVSEPDAVRRKIGVVFQAPSLDKKLTAIENLLHQGHLYGLRGAALRERGREMLARVGMAERSKEYVENLSGGMQRRVEVAKGLLHRPDILLLDEPSTGLDPGARRELWNYLKRLRDNDGVTILFTTHLMDEAERCDRLGILSEGRLVAMGSPDVLKAQIGGDVVVVFSKNSEALCESIRVKFACEPIVVDGKIHIERERGHEFIAQLVEAFPGQIESVSFGKPTLEDVFIHLTGQEFWHNGGKER